MLISSRRHKPGDLTLWHEMEEADRRAFSRLANSGKIERSIDAIRDFARRGDFYAGVSCGKDSTVLAHLCLRVRPDTALVYIRAVPHANPENDAFLAAWASRFPASPITTVVADYSTIPRSRSPDAAEKEKDRIFFAACRSVERDVSRRRALGVRASESGVRKLRMLRYGCSTEKTCAPIGWWSTADVFAYLAAHELPVHAAYAMLGEGRWERESLRVDELGGERGGGMGRREWEREYYGDVLRRLEAVAV